NAALLQRHLESVHPANVFGGRRLEPGQPRLTKPLVASRGEGFGHCEVGAEPRVETPRLGDRPARRIFALHRFIDSREQAEAVVAELGVEAPRPGNGPAGRICARPRVPASRGQTAAGPLSADGRVTDEANVGLCSDAHCPYASPSTSFRASANSIMVLSRKN